MDYIKKVAIGSAQFGLDYGIANDQGQVSRSQVKSIIHQAQALGVQKFDTSEAYGNAEKLLCELIDASQNHVVTTKFTGGSEGLGQAVKKVSQLFKPASQVNLLFHSPEVIAEGEKLVESIQTCELPEKLKLGFSIYEESELEALFSLNIPFSAIQLPYSLFDQRFAPYFAELQNRGVEIQARSIFLQGLAFKDKIFIQEKFGKEGQTIIDFINYCDEKDLTIAAILF